MLILNRDCFDALSDEDRSKSFELLGRVPCSLSKTLSLARDCGQITDSRCLICDGSALAEHVDVRYDDAKCHELAKEAILTFNKLLKSPAFLVSRRPRILAMFALRRFAVHFDDPDFIDLETSATGQWCLMSLKSSVRELRIAAG